MIAYESTGIGLGQSLPIVILSFSEFFRKFPESCF
jgi:hypothetical protein